MSISSRDRVSAESPTVRIVHRRDLTPSDHDLLFERRNAHDRILPAVREVMRAVRDEGDAALRRFTAQFDGAHLDHLEVTAEEYSAAEGQLSPAVRAALESAIQAVDTFHQTHLRATADGEVKTTAGVKVWREWRPIARIGLYVPGGRGPYPSSVVMLGVPARLAGCPEIVLCTPPGSNGSVPAATLVAARMTGIQRVFKVGGAQAIAAMAYGTESIPRVDKLFGAGNAYVTVAKLLAFPWCALDAPAGPSELLIIADGSANPVWIAADLISDLEHGPDSPAVLITTSLAMAHQTAEQLARQLADLPRAGIARQALHDWGLIVLVDSLDEAARLVDEYAPEHLEIMTADPHRLVNAVSNVASVFIGSYAANAAGDYATGSNHVLPTAGYARAYSPLSVESFGRLIQCQEVTETGLRTLLPTIATLAREEGLEGHARAIEARFIASEDHADAGG